jgi:hypothetical protein
MNKRRLAWAGLAFLSLTLSSYFALDIPINLPGDDFLRPRTLRHRAECILEKWGVIPMDPFRHVEG